MADNPDFERELAQLIQLLDKAGDEHWASYFRMTLDKYRRGNRRASFSHFLGAFGGMGSFNDRFFNTLSDHEVSQLAKISDNLWDFCKSEMSY